MIYDIERAIRVLKALLEVCEDGERGFRTAAEAVRSNPELTLVLHAYARERSHLAAELRSEIRRLGGHPHRDGSLGGVLHRGWMHLKAALTHGDEAALLGACESGEEMALRAYEGALRADPPPSQRDIIARHLAHIARAQEALRALRAARPGLARAH